MREKFYDKKERIFIIFILTACVLFVMWGFWRKSQLQSNHLLTVAQITGYAYGGRGNGGRLNVEYMYNIKGEQHKASTTYRATDFNCNEDFIGKTFPAVYNPAHPSISSILILPKDFDRYHYSFPNSLSWVKKYIN